ncbi:MAG: 7-cyano-7-deazaguanine synthase QueC [Alphaproteobacteria bacterium]|nr:7-cyano-7-deazaguanine synthase QueC [Alphaproteobacteria bacterium]
MSKALVLFSAGQDSATCLAWALTRFQTVETIGFDYGQRHRVELDQRAPLRAALSAWRGDDRLGEDRLVDLRGYGALAESALTTDRAIEMAADGLPTTFVPGRNLVFLAVAAAHAYRRGADVLVGGMCETDYAGYPDCRAETIAAMESALTLGLGRPDLRIETPLMKLSKAETWTLAHDLGGDALVALIEEASHTCYEGDRSRRHPWGYGCGACPACELRAAGWRAWRQTRP